MSDKWIRGLLFTGICIITFLTTSCTEKTGNILFTANGEEFVIEGLVSKEGWNIDFQSVLINISSPTAYNRDNPELEAVLSGQHLVDLKRGSAETPAVSMGIVPHSAVGNYQSMKFSIETIDSGDYSGYSIIIIGKASKSGTTIPFVIKLNEELTFDGREGYVGDSIKGMLAEGETTDVEMTFHFDHLFGNSRAEADDHVNRDSPGFELFLDFADEGRIDVDQNRMKNHPLYSRLIEGIETLGHLGEGHCKVTR